MVGAHLHLNRGFFASFFGLPTIKEGDRHCRETCLELLDFVGLRHYADTDTDSMPYGALKRLEIARALASKPKILLLDEPAAGLNPAESREIDEVIKKVAERGITVVLVEHDMKMVMEISDHILVLDYGRKLTEGTAQEVRNNPDVIAAYLGG
jgi:branched-chain amino acid transport system ATP-binding protein